MCTYVGRRCVYIMFGLCWCLQTCLKGLQIKACPFFLSTHRKSSHRQYTVIPQIECPYNCTHVYICGQKMCVHNVWFVLVFAKMFERTPNQGLPRFLINTSEEFTPPVHSHSTDRMPIELHACAHMWAEDVCT